MNFLKIEDEINYFQKMYVLRKEIENILQSEGYINIEPSIFEGYEEFTEANYRIDKRSTVKLLESTGDILILSPDITTGIINKLMMRWEPGLKLKLFYYGKTYKHNGTGIKENRQMGIEIMGEKDEKTDEIVLDTAIKIINKYNENYLFEAGNSKFLKGVMNACSFNKTDYEIILSLLYTKNKQELQDYLTKLTYREPFNTLINIFELEGSYDDIINKLNGLYINDLMKEGIEELHNLNQYFKNKTNNITYDLSMVSELSYYDGIIFRGYIKGSNKEIVKGGRYDSFTEQYGYKVPAIGFSIELDELIKILYKGVM